MTSNKEVRQSVFVHHVKGGSYGFVVHTRRNFRIVHGSRWDEKLGRCNVETGVNILLEDNAGVDTPT